MAKSENAATATVSLSVGSGELAKFREETQGLHKTFKRIPFGKLFANFDRNIRIKTGTEVLPGLKFEADSYEIDSLLIQVVELGYVRDPLTVSRKVNPTTGDEYYEILRGFRRYSVMKRIIEMGIHQNVIASFDSIPCDVYGAETPLTVEQENNLLNDQTSKQFLKCEVLREIWRRFGNGESWQLIGLTMSENIARMLGSEDALAKIRKAPTASEKIAEVSSWLNSSLNQFIQGIYIHAGPKIKRWFFLSYMEKDGLLGEKDEKSPIRWNAGVWTGKNGLYKAIKADKDALTWDNVEGWGPNTDEWFKKRIESQSGKTPTGKEVKVKSVQQIQAMLAADGRSEPIRQAIESVLESSPVYRLDLWDSKFRLASEKLESFKSASGNLAPDVRELLSLALSDSASSVDFDAKLASLVSAHLESQKVASEELPSEQPNGGVGEIAGVKVRAGKGKSDKK